MSNTSDKQIILITGGNNGIGFDTAALLASASPKNHVLLGSRNTEKGKAAIEKIQARNPKGTISLVQIDADSDASITGAVAQITTKYGRIDVLVNNAGICPEENSIVWPTRDKLRSTFETNVFGPAVLTEACMPLLKASAAPRIINVTSALGSIALQSDPACIYRAVKLPAYRMSKAALNMLTAYQHMQLGEAGFKVWTFCPGYVLTDLGGIREEKSKESWCESSETSAQGILEIVDGQRDAEVGTFITRAGEKYPW